MLCIYTCRCASFFSVNRSRESAEASVAFTVKTYGRMDTLVNGAAGNFLANAHELKLKVGSALLGTIRPTSANLPPLDFRAACRY